jgi:hypothetical protein
VLDFIHLSATGVAEIAECTDLKWCPHTFGDVVYIQDSFQAGILNGETGTSIWDTNNKQFYSL